MGRILQGISPCRLALQINPMSITASISGQSEPRFTAKLRWAAAFILLLAVRPAFAQFNYNTNPDGSVTIIKYTGGGGNVVIPLTIDGYAVTTIQDGAFRDNQSVGSVSIPTTVTNIGHSVFQNCRGLTSVVIAPGISSYGLGDSIFEGCSNLKSVTIPSGPQHVSHRMFQSCTSLTNVTLGTGIIGFGDSAFMDCTNLVSVSFPETLRHIGLSTFRNCERLREAPLPAGLEAIGEAAFWGCRSLSRVVTPAEVTRIGDFTFRFCDGLTSVVLGDRVTHVGRWAFGSCTNLVRATLGGSLTNVADWAFLECVQLRSVLFFGNAPTLGTGVFAGSTAQVYYLPDTQGWTSSFGGLTTLLWNPRIENQSITREPLTGAFGFSVQGSNKLTVVVEASADLLNWHGVATNALASGPFVFRDGSAAGEAVRLYRLQVP